MTPLEANKAKIERSKAKRERERQHLADKTRKLEFCQQVWSETVPAKGTLVETYLRGRGITGPIPPNIRFHPQAPLDYERKWLAPGMVAIATAPDGTAAGLHITALKRDGTGKADLDNPRRMFGETAGAVVQLGAIPKSGILAVGEGLETCLSYRDVSKRTCWSALSTSGLKAMSVPPGVSKLIIAADGDNAGRDAARRLAEKACTRCDVQIIPAPDGQDWNDVLKGLEQ